MLAAFPITPSAGYPGLRARGRGSTAVSFEAEQVDNATERVERQRESSQALFGKKAAKIDQLWALARECADENWDGTGAAAIEIGAVLRTEGFLRALPDRVPLPELAVEPDGAVSLDWIRSPRRLVSVSVGRGSRLAFAWLDGTNRGHAVERFDGETVPGPILERIEAVVGNGDAALRAP